MTPDDLKGKSDAELAYLVICQLSVACATVANVFGRRRYRAEEFLIQFRPKATSLRDALEMARQWSADLPVVVEAKAKEQAKEVDG
jgi:hypothetical protein